MTTPFNEVEFRQKVRNNEAITLRDARINAANSLSSEDTSHPCCMIRRAVYSESSSCECCKNSSNFKYCCTCNHISVNCGCCIYYGCFFAVCKNGKYPGTYTCTDLKGITYHYMALGDGKWGWWSYGPFGNTSKEEDDITCYCL